MYLSFLDPSISVAVACKRSLLLLILVVGVLSTGVFTFASISCGEKEEVVPSVVWLP